MNETDIAEHTELFYQSAEFWVAVTFIVVIMLLFSPIIKFINNQISQRINRIKNELHEAENLKLDAQKLYADYERKFINTDKEIEEFVANQKEMIRQTKEQKLHELDLNLVRQKNETDMKINQALIDMQSEINTKICQKTIDLISYTIRTKFTKNDYSKLIDASISRLDSINMVDRYE